MTLVLDASVVVEFLVGSRTGGIVGDHMQSHSGDLHLPHLAVVEAVSALRGWVRRGEISEERAAGAVADLADLPVRRWPGEPLLGRIWCLRENMSAYDACYVALAEALDAALLTADRRLARSAGLHASCRVVTVPHSGGVI